MGAQGVLRRHRFLEVFDMWGLLGGLMRRVHLKKFIGHRQFYIDVDYALTEARDLTARRIRNARKYLREFTLEEPKKVIDILDKQV